MLRQPFPLPLPGELRAVGAGIEEGGGSMGEPLLGQEVVGLNGRLDVVLVDPHRDPHQHVLGTLGHCRQGGREGRRLSRGAERHCDGYAFGWVGARPVPTLTGSPWVTTACLVTVQSYNGAPGRKL